MGDFGIGVSGLLQAFTTGSALIKRIKHQRKEMKTKVDSSVKAEEERLSKSLKTNRRDVKSVYDKCTRTRNFALGDAEAETSLLSILFRLQAGFLSILDRFLNGQSTHADYQMLMNLSNTSKLEAIQTFEQLQYRISQSSLSLGKTQPSEHRRKRRKHRKTSHNSSNHALIQSSSGSSKMKSGDLFLRQTYLGPATPRGWIRPKRGKKKQGLGNPNPNPSSTPIESLRTQNPLPLPTAAQKFPSSLPQSAAQGRPEPKPVHRVSIMTFATTSTKLGEISEHEWDRNSPSTVELQGYGGIRPAFPLHPYEEPEKQPSRLRKIFRRGK